MSTVEPLLPEPASSALQTMIDITVPVYNEERVLADSVHQLSDYLSHSMPYPYLITIADNASTDRTLEIAHALAEELPEVRVVHLDQKGRGRALKEVWSNSDADILAYVDVDLSTDLRALAPLLASLVSGHSDLAIGTRLAKDSRVVRGAKREFISRSYNLLRRGALAASFSDAQCGFKAIRADVAGQLLPMVEDTGWFFDTELLVLAQRAGLRIHEVPVDWVDDAESRVDIISTARADLRGMARLMRGFARGAFRLDEIRSAVSRRRPDPALNGASGRLLGQLLRFGGIGIASTAAYALLFWILAGPLGALYANVVALVVTAVANTAANRLLTFGIRGRDRLFGDHVGGLLAFGIGLILTTGSLWLMGTYWPDAARSVTLLVLCLANAVATVIRFVTLRFLFDHRAPGAPEPGTG